jgi:hypothetical protein
MTRRTYKNISGHTRHITDNPYFINCPSHEHDVRLAQAAFSNITKRMIAKRIDNDPHYRGTVQIRHIIKDFCRYLSLDPFRVLSARQREVCLGQLSEAAREQFRASITAEPSVPEGLRYLPKKPPMKKVEE